MGGPGPLGEESVASDLHEADSHVEDVFDAGVGRKHDV